MIHAVRPLPVCAQAASRDGGCKMASRSQPLVLGDGMRAAGIAVALSASLLVTPMLSHAEGTGGGMSLTFATREVRDKMRERDENMDFKCKGGMFDCDGDRREFAKQQYQNFVARMDGGQQGDEQQQAQATQGAAVTNEGQ